MENLYALIMAGGGGTRLWPLSRKDRPKQMLSLVEDRTMFHIAVDRLAPILPPQRIFVVTGASHVESLRADVPDLPADNFVVEPFGMNTGPAVGLGIAHILRADPEAVIAVLTADQYIADEAKFCRVLSAAGELASQGHIVTLGITPTFPATGYGYIKRGDALAQVGEFQTYQAASFHEKPNAETAQAFLDSGLYSWNSGMFIFRADHLMSEYERQQPTLYGLLSPIAAAIGRDDYAEVLNTQWGQMPKLSIDYAIMEKAPHMAVIPVEMGWSDIGTWKTLFEVLEGDQQGNVLRGRAHNQHIQIDTAETLIVSDRMVVTIGVQDIVIVDAGDVVLVCHRDRSQDVRQVVDQLKAKGLDALV